MDPSTGHKLVAEDGYRFDLVDLLSGNFTVEASNLTPAQRAALVQDRADELQRLADVVGLPSLHEALHRSIAGITTRVGQVPGYNHWLRGQRLACYWTPNRGGKRTIDALYFVRDGGLTHQHMVVEVSSFSSGKGYVLETYGLTHMSQTAQLEAVLALPEIGPALTAHVLLTFDDMLEKAITLREQTIARLQLVQTPARRLAARKIRPVPSGVYV